MEKTTVKSNFDFGDYPNHKLKAMIKLMDLDKHLDCGKYTQLDVFASKILKNEMIEAIKYQIEVEKLSDSEPSEIDFTDGLEYEVGKDIYPCKLLVWSGIGPREKNKYFKDMDRFYEQYNSWKETMDTLFSSQQTTDQNNNQQSQQLVHQQQSQPAGSPLFNNNQQAAARLPFSNGAGQVNNPVPTPKAIAESIRDYTINTIMQAVLQVPENMQEQYCSQIDSAIDNMQFDFDQFNIGQQQCSIPIEHVIAAQYYNSNQQNVPVEQEQYPSIVTEEQQQAVPNQEEQQIPSEEPQEAVTLFSEMEAETFSLSNKEIEENAQNFKKIYSNYNSISKDARDGVKAPLAAFCRLLEAEKEKGVDTDSYNFKIMNPKKLSEDQIIFKDFNNHITGMVIKNPDGSYLPTITPDIVPV